MPDSLLVTSCLRFDADRPSFALPLLKDPANTAIRYIQEIDQTSNLVARFRKLEGETENEIPITRWQKSQIGFPQIYCFVDQEGVVWSGTLLELEPILKAFMEEYGSQAGLILQIADLIGTADEKRITRQHMKQVIDERSGSEPARAFYQGSVLRSELWDRLLSEARDADAADQILLSRLHIDVTERSGRIALKSNFVNLESLLMTSVSKIEQELTAEFCTPDAANPINWQLDDEKPNRDREFAAPDWGLKWLNRWYAAENDDRALAKLSREGEFWLLNAAAGVVGWFQVWFELWSLPDSERQERLQKLAVAWLRATEPSDTTWLILWETTLKHCKLHSPEHISSLINLALRWLSQTSGRAGNWASTWRKVWAIAKASKVDEEKTSALGHRWLRQNGPHSGWASIWRTLWDEYKTDNPEAKSELLKIGVSWMRENLRHPGWPSVWLRLWAQQKEAQQADEELSVLALNWLEQGDAGANSWLPVWQALWNESASLRAPLDVIRKRRQASVRQS
jgi:hypothetical protein